MRSYNIRSLKITILISTIFSLNRAKILIDKDSSPKHMRNIYSDCDAADEENNILISLLTSLCKKFPHVPCQIITKDKTLQRLIEKSLQKIRDSLETNAKALKTTQYLKTNRQPSAFPNKKELGSTITKVKRMKEKTKLNSLKGRKNKPGQTMTKKHNRITLQNFHSFKVKYEGNAMKPREKDVVYPEDQYAIKNLDLDLAKTHQHFLFKLQPKELPYWKIRKKQFFISGFR